MARRTALFEETETWRGVRPSNDHRDGQTRRVYEGGRVEANQFKAARWDF